MKLWSIQPKNVLDEIRSQETFRCDASRSYNLSKSGSLRLPYQWLISQMEKKIGPRPSGVNYPIWAWHTWNFQRTKPDPDSSAFLERTESKVFLTLEIPDSQVVLTDFDAWQNVLRNSYVSAATDEKSYERASKLLDTLSDEELKSEIQKSWQNVFRIDPINNEYLVRGRYVQATFWEIRKEYISDWELLKPNNH